jgi:hypothetical protein
MVKFHKIRQMVPLECRRLPRVSHWFAIHHSPRWFSLKKSYFLVYHQPLDLYGEGLYISSSTSLLNFPISVSYTNPHGYLITPDNMEQIARQNKHTYISIYYSFIEKTWFILFVTDLTPLIDQSTWGYCKIYFLLNNRYNFKRSYEDGILSQMSNLSLNFRKTLLIMAK